MIASIHQPHYFPWIGYFDKMAKADTFVILDQVQFEKGSQMIRNRVLSDTGEVKYITISGNTKDFLNREYRELATKNVEEWTSRQMNALQSYYRKARCRSEIFPLLEKFFQGKYPTICEWTCASMNLIREILEIKTPLLYQSAIEYDRNNKRSDLVYAICNAIGADIYFSGRGASMTYLDRGKFAENGVKIVFQDFQHPIYPQCNSSEFIPGISVLDMLFNCGIEESRQIFWNNVKQTHEFETNEA